MAFGQASGPPATGRQVQELLGLLHEAGHTDFRDARGPMGFNQRQAGGRFTREEAAAFIEQLQREGEEERPDPAPAPAPPRAEAARRVPRAARAGSALDQVPAEELAGELRRRGWMVIEPIEGL
jgi:hypothetical protein